MDKKTIIEKNRKNSINKYFKTKKVNHCRDAFVENLHELCIEVKQLVDFVFVFKYIKLDVEECRKTRWTCFDEEIIEENMSNLNLYKSYTVDFILNTITHNVKTCLCNTEIKNIYNICMQLLKYLIFNNI